MNVMIGHIELTPDDLDDAKLAALKLGVSVFDLGNMLREQAAKKVDLVADVIRGRGFNGAEEIPGIYKQGMTCLAAAYACDELWAGQRKQDAGDDES